jgi:uncharacterized protein (DUF427 family)
VRITLPDGSTPQTDDDLSDWLGRRVRLVAAGQRGGLYENPVDPEDEDGEWTTWRGPGGAFHDSTRTKVSLVSTETIGAWDVRRFRPNIVVERGGEDDLVGSTVMIGSAELSIAASSSPGRSPASSATSRCSAPSPASAAPSSASARSSRSPARSRSATKCWHARDMTLTITPIDQRVTVVIDGETVAESTRALLLQEQGVAMPRYYLPRDDVRMELLEPTDTSTRCSRKGDCSYWSVRIGDAVHTDVVWSYEAPIPGAEPIAGRLAFYNDRVDLKVE